MLLVENSGVPVSRDPRYLTEEQSPALRGLPYHLGFSRCAGDVAGAALRRWLDVDIMGKFRWKL